MKIFKRVMIWASISIAIQFSGLFYINNFFLSESTNIKVNKIISKNSGKSNVEVYIPEGAKNVSASYNGRYIAYYDNDGLKVINTSTGDKKVVEFSKGVKVSYYKWLSDRNRMLIAEKHTSEGSNDFQLAYYDVDKDTKDKIEYLTSAGSKAEISHIEASPLTNMIYIKLANSDNRNSIYSVNIMKEIRKVSTYTNTVGNICIVPHEDNLIYEDYAYKKIYSTKTGKAIEIAGVDKSVLLSVDSNDNVYIGALSGDTINRIYYGPVGADTSTYKTADPGTAADNKEVLVSNDGMIYLNDNFRGKVTELATGKEYTYPGNFIQIYEGGVLSLSDNQAVKTAVK
ncbi:MAG: hypothetical protein AB9844_12660 [Clostridiaceae bacterium]